MTEKGVSVENVNNKSTTKRKKPPLLSERRLKRLVTVVAKKEVQKRDSAVHNYVVARPVMPRSAFNMFAATLSHLRLSPTEIKTKWQSLPEQTLYEKLAYLDTVRYHHEIQAVDERHASLELIQRLETRMQKERETFAKSFEMNMLKSSFNNFLTAKKNNFKNRDTKSLFRVFYQHIRKVLIHTIEEADLVFFIDGSLEDNVPLDKDASFESYRSEIQNFVIRCLNSRYSFVEHLQRWLDLCFYYGLEDAVLTIVKSKDVIFYQHYCSYALSSNHGELRKDLKTRFKTLAIDLMRMISIQKRLPLAIVHVIFRCFLDWDSYC